MRHLTQQEIDNAPDWATHYFTYNNDKEIRWQDNIKHLFMWSHEGKIFPFPRKEYQRGEQIPRKEFDTKSELTSLLQMCVNDMYTPSGKIKKKTARKLTAACQKGLVNYPE